MNTFYKAVALFAWAGMSIIGYAQDGAPRLEKRGDTTQLIVDGKPFVILGGELHNSSSSNLDYMRPLWPKLAGMGLNTVVTPLSWELLEPREGTYDYALADGLLAQAREAHERVVFLWLASWKNGMSSYAPVWVKQDSRRFPRVVVQGHAVEVLSPMSSATREADARAFAALMRHLKEVDAQHTVIMMQVENEVGVLGDSRDRSEAANRAFYSAVPAELTSYLQAHREALYPSLRACGKRTVRRLRVRGRRCLATRPRATRSSWPGTTGTLSRRWPRRARRLTIFQCM